MAPFRGLDNPGQKGEGMPNYSTARRRREPGLVIKHLKGDYSLARSYWLHTVLLGWGTSWLGIYAIQQVGEHHAARHASMTLLAYLCVALLITAWSLAGAWMSAIKSLFGRGGRFWAILAMLSLAVGAVGTMREYIELRPALREHWAIAQGEQPAEDFDVVLLDEGRVVSYTGGVNEGASRALDQVIADAPRVTTVLLESPGGWMREGERMAAVIRRYGLSTRVETECHSACTVAFLAGIDRTLGEGAVLGFHRGRAPGQDAKGESEAHDAEVYAKAGLPQAFIRRVLDTPHDDIWMPTRRELLKAGVLTR
jgi:hypothetical protein